jgi:hypothetical protein
LILAWPFTGRPAGSQRSAVGSHMIGRRQRIMAAVVRMTLVGYRAIGMPHPPVRHMGMVMVMLVDG